MDQEYEIIRADQICKGDRIEVVHQHPGVVWFVEQIDTACQENTDSKPNRVTCHVTVAGSSATKNSLDIEHHVRVRRYRAGTTG